MQVSLELSGHPKANVRSVVIGRTTVVGRSRECGLRIASASVSRKHCEIRIAGDQASVIDLGSSNGTFIDTDRLPAGEERQLLDGSRLNLGGIRFVVSYAQAGPPADGEAPVAAAITGASPLDESNLAEEPNLADEPGPAEAPILIDEDATDARVFEPLEPILVDDALPGEQTMEIPASSHDIDLIDEAFEPEPPLAQAPTEEQPAEAPEVADEAPLSPEPDEDEPILEADEPILPAEEEALVPVEEQAAVAAETEDEAFGFLMDDEDDSPSMKPEDSRLGDFLNQLGRD